MEHRDNPAAFRSVSGQAETAEPAGSGTAVTTSKRETVSSRSQHTSQSTSTSSSSTPTLRKSSSSALTPTISSPLAQSPRNSRNTSPIRKDKPPPSSSALSTQPSAAAIQRALSASSAPNLQQQPTGATVTDAVSRLPRANSKSATGSGDTTPSWPISPRLKSPPPSGPPSRRGSSAQQKKIDAPSIQVSSASPQNTPPAPSTTRQTSSDKARPELPPASKSITRGSGGKSTLETVQENASDSQEPSPAAVQAANDLRPLTKISDDENTPVGRGSPKSDEQQQQQQHAPPGESGSESAGNKSDTARRGRRNSASQPANNSQPPRSRNPSKSTYSTSTTKSRAGDGKQNMTVETETVQSIPQSGLAPASESSNRLRSDGGSVKLKPSNETIRPKKERKKVERKARSINQGSAATKADLFEARVANYVEEANTSDSDETFVYESNPPEPQRRQRHHSRTPSVTSSHSLAEQQPRGGLRQFGDNTDPPRVGGKRSMKFSSNPYTDTDGTESKDGTLRSHTPRHIGRFGRGGHHSASYDQQNSPYSQASRSRQNHPQRSRPTSPKGPLSGNMQLRMGSGLFSNIRKQEVPYDFDVEQNADDERTPLMGPGTVRGPRARGQRRMISSNAQSMYEDPEDQRWWHCFSGRTGSCFLTFLVLVLVVLSATGFVLASNRSLYSVKIQKIDSVLASEEELMLDLIVSAVNPNTWTITISDMDLDIFAKSTHVAMADSKSTRGVRSQSERRTDCLQSLRHNPRPSEDSLDQWHAPQTLPNTGSDSSTMLLGRIFHFDEGLGFGPSPFKPSVQLSSGQVRLMRPGNETETGGSARWEKMIEKEFELIVRGVLKYQLPISARQQRVAVGACVTVHPEDGIDEQGHMRVEPVDHSDHWQWIDLPDDMDDEPFSKVFEHDEWR